MPYEVLCMLWCAALSYDMLCYLMLCYDVLYYAVICFTVLCCVMLWRVVLSRTAAGIVRTVSGWRYRCPHFVHSFVLTGCLVATMFVQLCIIPVGMSCIIRQVTVGWAACPKPFVAVEERKSVAGVLIHNTQHTFQPSVSLLDVLNMNSSQSCPLPLWPLASTDWHQWDSWCPSLRKYVRTTGRGYGSVCSYQIHLWTAQWE
jgi:hypothetical protein